MTIPNTETLSKHINQNGVRPGFRKFIQFQLALSLRNVPKLYEQDGKGEDAMVFVKIFDPCGSMTWYITECSDKEAFGLVVGNQETELGYMNLEEMANIRGHMGIGLEIDIYFLPTTLREVRKLHRA